MLLLQTAAASWVWVISASTAWVFRWENRSTALPAASPPTASCLSCLTLAQTTKTT
eukprot:31988_4